MKENIPKKRNWIAIILILIALYLASAVLANFASLFSYSPSQAATSGNIAFVPVKGVISADGYQDILGSRSLSSDKIVELIEKAEGRDRIKAIVLEINSPGGTAVASEEIARAVRDSNKTTVAWIREVGASGAYWVASASDHVVASEVSLTGSIGVIGSYLDFSQFIEDWNVTYQRLVAGEHKDVGSPYKTLTDEEREILQGKLDKVHEYFIERVAENRDMSETQVEDFATGLTYLGSEALDIGLIDETGGKEEALAYVESELNITAKPSYYQSRSGLFDFIGQVTARHGYSIGAGLKEEPSDFSIRT